MRVSMQCGVCLLEASGLHFGIPSCRACAAFFRRSIGLKLTYKCQREERCDVTKKQRFCCRYCRLEKCLSMGMRPSMVQPGASDPQASQVETTTPTGASYITQESPSQVESPSTSTSQLSYTPTPNPYTNQAADETRRRHSDMQKCLKMKVDMLFDEVSSFQSLSLPIRLSVTQQAVVALTEHSKKWPLCTTQNVRPGDVMDIETVLNQTYQEIENIAVFCMSLEDFARLQKDQKWIIFKYFWPKFIPLERYLSMARSIDRMTPSTWLAYDGRYYDFSEQSCEDVLKRSGEEMMRLFNLIRPSCEKGVNLLGSQLIKTKPTAFEITFCLLQAMWSLKGENGISDEIVLIAEGVRKRVAEEMHNYYTFDTGRTNYAVRIMQLMNILSAIDELEMQRREDSTLFRMFDLARFDIFVSELTHQA